MLMMITRLDPLSRRCWIVLRSPSNTKITSPVSRIVAHTTTANSTQDQRKDESLKRNVVERTTRRLLLLLRRKVLKLLPQNNKRRSPRPPRLNRPHPKNLLLLWKLLPQNNLILTLPSSNTHAFHVDHVPISTLSPDFPLD